jgi:hypothetical protein
MLIRNCEWYVPVDKKKFTSLFTGTFSQEFYESVEYKCSEVKSI